MAKITFKITAVTDVGLVRTNNEDNFVAISNLDLADSTWKSDEVCELGEKGALLVVADGMGGMNAGEVASEIAISTVKELFTTGITEKTLSSSHSIISFMNEAIVTADKRIKSEGKHNPESRGMGTTIVIAWLYKGLLYVSWCGDSRAYIYNEALGLVQITKDHSYVQELVDQGVISPEDAFDFPESNVITRCLSHSSLKAEPENLRVPYRVSQGDIILLCTDGLSGMIRDNEISSIIAANTTSMADCANALIEAAKAAAGADNITVDLCQVLSVGNDIVQTPTASLEDFQQPTLQPGKKKGKRNSHKVDAPSSDGQSKITQTLVLNTKRHSGKIKVIVIVLLLLAVAVGGHFAWKYFSSKPNVEPTEQPDSVAQQDSSDVSDIDTTYQS